MQNFPEFPQTQLSHSPKLQEILKHGPFQAVVGLGMNWELTQDQAAWELRVQGRLNALVCLLVYRLGLANAVILSGGHTVGNNNNAEAEEMLSICADILGDKFVPEDFFIETESLDTSGNVIGINSLLDTDGDIALNDLLLLTTSDQLNGRVNQYIKAFGLDEINLKLPSEKLAEELILYIAENADELKQTLGEEEWMIVESIINHLAAEVSSLRQTKDFMFGKLYQAALSLLTIVDPEGNIIRNKAQKRAEYNSIPTVTEPYPTRFPIES